MLLAAILPACSHKSATSDAGRLDPTDALPIELAGTTTLRLGDPAVQKQLALSGGLAGLPFTVAFQNISGGPQTIEAFRADALDGGVVGDTPPIHAVFTGLDVKIIAVQRREKPIYQLAAAPGAHLSSIRDLRAKKIAYSPGQAQGALVLRVLKKAGLSPQDVTLIELESTAFVDALASRQVEVAPLSGTVLLRYLNQYRAEGASSIAHGVSDNLGFFYVRTAVLENAAKAAALGDYVKRRARAQLWADAHQDAWINAYYVRDQGLKPEEGRYLVETIGRTLYPRDWTEAIAVTQETIEFLAQASGQKWFDARKLFDLRFQTLAADVADQAGGTEATKSTTISDGSKL